MTIEEMIRDIVKDEFNKLSVQFQDQVFNAKEAAEYLRISRDWLYKNLDSIPHSNVGGYKFLKSQLDNYVKEKQQDKNVSIHISNYKGNGCDFKVKW